MSARGLDLLAGLTPGHVGSLENGSKGDAQGATLAKLAAVLGCTIDHLVIGGAAHPGPGELDVARTVLAARERQAAPSPPVAP